MLSLNLRFDSLHSSHGLRAVLLSLLATGACATAEPGTGGDDFDPPLANLDEILEGAPKADEIPRIERKGDEILPAEHVSLLDLQSPVKSQGRRGVCSIFSTVALMEHLYISEGTISQPDFSEQYLQWSAKFEVNSFPASSGSNATYNLQAISRFGVVEESTLPYEIEQWGVDDDPDCDGEDDQPTECYTNGHPSDAVKNSEKFFLPRSRWLHPSDIKSHIQQNDTGAVVGLTFFYQSWNHRKSELPRNIDSWNQGFVTYPSAKDEELSMVKRAGHSILLVGWDDNQEMPRLDEEGNYVLDASGEVVAEKGCFVFKNSWGTEGFGIDSKWGPGYGCISYQYIREHGRVRVAGLPQDLVVPEVCDDGLDNDGNGDTDCDDTACSAEPTCEIVDTSMSFEGEGGLDIPDNSPVGVSSTISIDEAGTIGKFTVKADISHSYRGDLRVTLYRGNEAIVLHDGQGGSSDDLVIDSVIADFDDSSLAGDYRLVIVDSASIDTGVLNSWSLQVELN